ncbi:MAG: 3-oxoacyl-ACP synthase [Flavobacteriaceae bacterium]|nr:3-oxoacyl-ACP synthase [Flavobacteriaceae bacterium]
MQQYFIEAYSHIQDARMLHNGKTVFEAKGEDFNSFIKTSYKHLGLNYAKFFKMDRLSKLAFLGAELLLEAPLADAELDDEVALVFSNKASSLDTDYKHQESIQDAQQYFPSPAVFVYTLPNISVGEISIRHKLCSENSFFIFETFNAELLHNYAEILLKEKRANSVLCAWVELEGENYNSFMYKVGYNGEISHTKDNIRTLYNLE